MFFLSQCFIRKKKGIICGFNQYNLLFGSADLDLFCFDAEEFEGLIFSESLGD